MDRAARRRPRRHRCARRRRRRRAVARSTAWLRHRAVRHVLAVGSGRHPRLATVRSRARIVGNASEAGRVTPDLVRGGGEPLSGRRRHRRPVVIDPWLCATFLLGMPIYISRSAVRARRLRDRAALPRAARDDRRRGSSTRWAAPARSRPRAPPAREAPRRPRAASRPASPGRGDVAHADADRRPGRRPGLAARARGRRGRRRPAVAGRITPGELLAASEYVLLAATSVGDRLHDRLARSRAAAARIDEVLEEPACRHGAALAPAGPGRLEFRGVSAGRRAARPRARRPRGPGRPRSSPSSGAAGRASRCSPRSPGASLDPEEGEVVLDGVPLGELSRDELRRAVGYGFERPVLIGGTVADAIAFGGEAPSPRGGRRRGARRARGRFHPPHAGRLCDVACAGADVRWEAQRIGLARRSPRAQARRARRRRGQPRRRDRAADSQGAHRALAGRTRIVVAHRGPTAARADLVVWLDGGTVRAVASTPAVA